MEINDVRLVYAPARGDRRLRRRDRQLRVAAPHRRLLVPPRVRRRQAVSPGALAQGLDERRERRRFVLVAGYPGRTFRYKTADEVRNFQEFVYPTTIRYYTELDATSSKKRGRTTGRRRSRTASRIKGFELAEELRERQRRIREGPASSSRGCARERGCAPREPQSRHHARRHRRRSTRRSCARASAITSSTGSPGRGSPMFGQAFNIARAGDASGRRRTSTARARYQERDWPRSSRRPTRAQRMHRAAQRPRGPAATSSRTPRSCRPISASSRSTTRSRRPEASSNVPRPALRNTKIGDAGRADEDARPRPPRSSRRATTR